MWITPSISILAIMSLFKCDRNLNTATMACFTLACSLRAPLTSMREMLYIFTSKWDCPVEGLRVSRGKMVRQHKLTPEPWEFRKQCEGEDSDGTCPLCPASYYHTDKASITHGGHRDAISLLCVCTYTVVASQLYGVWSRPPCYPKCFQANESDSLALSKSN